MILKTVAALAASLAMAGTMLVSPAIALSPDDPGYFNDCAAAYVADPALYERDCVDTQDSLSGPSEPVECEVVSLMPVGYYYYVADYDPCYEPVG